MNLDIIDTHRRYIANTHPVLALIERREHSEMSARIKQFWIDGIFAYDFDWIGRWKVAGHRLPRFSQVGRSQNRRTLVPRAITIDSNVRHIRIKVRRLDARHPLTTRRL